MTIAAEPAISSKIPGFRKDRNGTGRQNSLIQNRRNSMESLAMAEETVPPEHYKERLKALGWTQRDFSQWLGIHGSTTGKWWLTMVPLYAIRIIELLEKTSVAAPPRLARGKPGPTEAEARDAMRPAATAVIDEAIRQGWSRAQIAASLRTFADETEGR